MPDFDKIAKQEIKGIANELERRLSDRLKRVYDDIKTLLERADQRWRSIEEEGWPDKGGEYYWYAPNTYGVQVGQFVPEFLDEPDMDAVSHTGVTSGCLDDATHWMPKPPPPGEFENWLDPSTQNG